MLLAGELLPALAEHGIRIRDWKSLGTPTPGSGRRPTSAVRCSRCSRRWRSTPGTRSRSCRTSRCRWRSRRATRRPTSGSSRASRSRRSCRASCPLDTVRRGRAADAPATSRVSSSRSSSSSPPTSTSCSRAWRSSAATRSGSRATWTSTSSRTRRTTCCRSSTARSAAGASAPACGWRSQPDIPAAHPRAPAREAGDRRGGRLRVVRRRSGLRALMSLAAAPAPTCATRRSSPRLTDALAEAARTCSRPSRQGDILLHHPYDSFQPVLDFLRRAADDPAGAGDQDDALPRRLERRGRARRSSRAAENGKQVAVSIELKARFDEENNIAWARALERAGAHVFFGPAGLKTHAKVVLVVRREEGRTAPLRAPVDRQLQRGTARLYTDLGLFTRRPRDRRGRLGALQRALRLLQEGAATASSPSRR